MNYISSNSQIALGARYRLTAIIVAALGISTVLYVIIGWFFAPAMARGDYEWLTNSHYAIVMIVFIAALALIFFRRFWFSPARLLRTGRQSISSLLTRLHMSSLIGAVLGDVVGILGVVASLLTGNKEYSWRLGIAALLMIAYSFPRRGEWERAVAVAEQEKNNPTGQKSDSMPENRLGLTDAE